MGNWGRVNIGSGGGGGLNFEVIGGTSAPSSPKENTIWVNTTVAITSWVFSAIEPTNPVAGMVWFKTNASSAAAFNAIKKNGLWVYPAVCRQYVSNTWTNKTAQTYRAGEWVDWQTYLFDNGDQITALTGGWVQGNKWWYEGSYAVVDAVIDTSMVLDITYPTQASLRTALKIDLTDYDTLYANLQWSKPTTVTRQCPGGLAVSTIETNTSSANIYNKSDAKIDMDGTTSFTGVKTIDISALSGEYYIYVYCGRGDCSLTVNSIWLE